MLHLVDVHNSSYPSLPGGNSTTLTMCIKTIFLCGICQTAVGWQTHPCPPPFQRASNHVVQYAQPYTIRPPAPYSCPNPNCVASTELHWALHDQQLSAIKQGKANMDFLPFHEIKAMCGDNDEACDLALEPVEVTGRKTKRVRQAPPSPGPVAGYPPFRPEGARIGPEWLSSRQWLKACALKSRGKNILEMADAVGVNASKLRIYADLYLKDISPYDGSPLPSANSTNSSNATTNSTAGSSGSESALFPLDQEITVPQAGAPHPSFLNHEEQEAVWQMFQQNETVRNMADGVHKNRHKLSQYINVYMRPRLLTLQAEQRRAEDAAPPITPLSEGILQFPPCNLVAPIAAPSRSPSLTGDIPQTLASQPGAPIAAVPGSISSQEPSLPSSNNAELDAFLKIINPMFLNPPVAVPETEGPKTSGEVTPLETPKSVSDEDSLFGNSPIDEYHVGSQMQIVSTHHEVETALPMTPRKRKFEDNSEIPAQPRRASKRLRHRSLP